LVNEQHFSKLGSYPVLLEFVHIIFMPEKSSRKWLMMETPEILFGLD